MEEESISKCAELPLDRFSYVNEVSGRLANN